MLVVQKQILNWINKLACIPLQFKLSTMDTLLICGCCVQDTEILKLSLGPRFKPSNYQPLDGNYYASVTATKIWTQSMQAIRQMA